MKKKLIITLLVLSPLLGKAQEDKRTIGLTASLQTSQMDIMVPIWLGESIVIAPSINVSSVENAGTSFGVGLVPKFFLNSKKLRPYVSARAALFMSSSSNNNQFETNNTMDILTGLAFGGEYFFDPRFSLGVEAQANVTISDENSAKFGNPGGINFNTGMAILANVYF